MSRRLVIAAAGLAMTAWMRSAGAQVAPPAPESIAVGDWLLTPVAELRARGEYRRDVDDENHGLLVERTRLGIDATRGPLEARVVVQDARAIDLGTGSDAIVGPGALSVTGAYEAWAEVHTPSARPSFLRAGRQPITWGEGRLLGDSDWSPTGRSLDAMRGRLVVGDGAFELLGAALEDPQTSDALLAYGELAGARFEWAFDPLFALDAYALARFAQTEPSESLGKSIAGETYTGSLRLHGEGQGWSWGGEGAYQVGRAADLGVHRAAWAAAAHAGYTFEAAALRPSLRAGAAYASGGANGSTARTFDPLLPDVHTWHGAMDAFAWSNEEEVNGRVSIDPWTDAVAAVEFRYAQLANADGPWRTGYLTTIGEAAGNPKASLGHEIDASLRWSPWAPLSLEAGYSILFLGDGARAVLAASAVGPQQSVAVSSTPPPLSHFAYAQGTVVLP